MIINQGGCTVQLNARRLITSRYSQVSVGGYLLKLYQLANGTCRISHWGNVFPSSLFCATSTSRCADDFGIATRPRIQLSSLFLHASSFLSPFMSIGNYEICISFSPQNSATHPSDLQFQAISGWSQATGWWVGSVSFEQRSHPSSTAITAANKPRMLQTVSKFYSRIHASATRASPETVSSSLSYCATIWSLLLVHSAVVQ